MSKRLQNYALGHLRKPDTVSSLQNDEALFMYSLVKVTNPKVIVEFGFCKGFSAKNFLASMADDALLYSYDPDPVATRYARRIRDKRFRFLGKRGEDFSAEDIDHQHIDLLLLDASHEFSDSMDMFGKIYRQMAPGGIIIVHDTGLFGTKFMKPQWKTPDGIIVGDGYAHRPQERLFVNHLKCRYPQLQQIHFHSWRSARMGFTLLQNHIQLSNGTFGRNLVMRYYATCLKRLLFSVVMRKNTARHRTRLMHHRQTSVE